MLPLEGSIVEERGERAVAGALAARGLLAARASSAGPFRADALKLDLLRAFALLCDSTCRLVELTRATAAGALDARALEEQQGVLAAAEAEAALWVRADVRVAAAARLAALSVERADGVFDELWCAARPAERAAALPRPSSSALARRSRAPAARRAPQVPPPPRAGRGLLLPLPRVGAPGLARRVCAQARRRPRRRARAAAGLARRRAPPRAAARLRAPLPGAARARARGSDRGAAPRRGELSLTLVTVVKAGGAGATWTFGELRPLVARARAALEACRLWAPTALFEATEARVREHEAALAEAGAAHGARTAMAPTVGDDAGPRSLTRSCARCGVRRMELRKCSDCRVCYCSPACQRAHWPEHKAACRAAAA